VSFETVNTVCQFVESWS